MNLTISSLTAIFICRRDLSTSRPDKKETMFLTRALLAMLVLLVVDIAAAADNNLLIQTEAGGGYTVWHAEGVTNLSEDEILTLAAGAEPQGGPAHKVSAGTARAFQTAHGVVIDIADAKADRKLLIDRDECGAIKIWHSEGETRLTDEQMTELVISALPGGGRRVKVDGNHAKAFITPLGYTVVIWKPVVR
jgi:hypothetical protein